MDFEETLEHYGIKGMKWGVRRTREQLDRAAGRRLKKGKPVTKTQRVREKLSKKGSDSSPQKKSHDAERVEKIQKKVKKDGLKSLSNQEIQLLNNRLNLEQSYSKITSEKSKLEKGQEFAKKTIGVAQTINQIIQLANSPLIKQIRKTLNK